MIAPGTALPPAVGGEQPGHLAAGQAKLVRETVDRGDRAGRQVIWYPAQPWQGTQLNRRT